MKKNEGLIPKLDHHMLLTALIKTPRAALHNRIETGAIEKLDYDPDNAI